MSNLRKSLGGCLFGAVFSLIIPAILAADNDGAPENKTEFHLSGTAHRKKNGIISIIITNKSPDDCDYLIEFTEPSIDSLREEDSTNVLMTSLPHPFGGGLLQRVAASKANQHLLIADQMFRFEMQIPDEYKDSKIDQVKINLCLCKTPIAGKKVILSSAVVKAPLLTSANEPDADR